MEKNIIDLDLIDNLSESGVLELALVGEPAINKIWIAMGKQKFVNPSAGESEDEFIPRCIAKLVGDEGYETDQAAAICYSTWEAKLNDAFLWPDFAEEEFAETYTDYPEGAVANAKRALDWADKNGWGDCGMGPGKARANQLANREPISEETIARMSAFERHRQNSETPYSEGCGKLMWDAWGGDAGIRWAKNKLREIRGEEFSYDTSALPAYVDEIPKKKKMKMAEDCPEATQDIALNLENRQNAIDIANYGPLNPNRPSEGYWKAKARMFEDNVEDAKSARCSNCAFFITTQRILACIAEGIGTEGEDPYDIIDAGQLGYCEAFDFKCAAERTCDAWVTTSEEKFAAPASGNKGDRPLARIPKEERGRTGSAKNKPGDTKTTRGGIEVSQEVESTLKDKIEEHNKKNSQDSQKATLGMLKSVWRRGAGAYSVGTPGKRGMARAQWAMARVNSFLNILAGNRSGYDKDYNQDNDLLPKGHPKHSEEKMSKQYFSSEDQQILVGPVAIPDIKIVRQDEETKEVYWVKFSKEVIQRMAEKFMKENRNNETNIEHDNKVDAKSYIYESWIVESENDKANSIYNLDVPVGTWVVKMRVTDPEVWKQVKSGELNGFSLEGSFIDKKELDQINKDKSTYEKIMKILKSI
jgi:hypothetical protein